MILPVIKLWQHILHMDTRLFLRKAIGSHMLNTNVDKLVHIVIRIITVGIAPLAVILVEAAVDLLADKLVLKRHTAALTYQLSRRAQNRVDGHVEQLRQELQRFRVGHCISCLPA